MTKPVIVYGASGYTGRLVCEYLREFNLPFVAAGRDKTRIQEALDKVPGIDTVEHEIVEVAHDVAPLTELFDGASVVCNTVGPFAQYGREVIEACLNAGCHYLDTTGEQDWLITCDDDYGQRMAEKGLLLAPGVAQMYTTGEIAAQLCLEKPGVDTLDILVFWKGMPTIASTRTILVNAALSKAYYLEQNSYVEWPADAGLYDVVIPGQHETGLALPWGGTSHPVWFKRDPRVANVKVLGGVFNRALMLGVPQIVKAVLEQIEGLPENEKLRVLTEQAAGVMNQMPPREATRINTSLDSVHASGPLGRAHCVIHGNSNYKQTGLMQAYGAYSLLQQPPKRVGFASGCQAFGHRELLGVLRSFGLVMEPNLTVHHYQEDESSVRLTDYLDKGASLGPEAPCLTTAGRTLTYGDVQRLSWRIARALDRSGVRPGRQGRDLVGERPGRVQLRVRHLPGGRGVVPGQPAQRGGGKPRPAGLLRLPVPDLPGRVRPAGRQDRCPTCPKLTTLVCLDGEPAERHPFDLWIGPEPAEPWQAEPADDLVMLVGTGGTTGRPKGVMLTGHNIETMSALTLMSYPFCPRPRYLALAPLTHAAGVLCFPVMTLGGEIVIMPKPDLAEFLALVEQQRDHAHVPAADPDLHAARPRPAGR